MAKKTIDVETAVQVALLNNKGLQASYADLGDSAADAWQTQLSVLPTFSVGLSGIGTPGLEAYQVLEGAIAGNILALATYDRNIKLADQPFQAAQLKAAIATISLAAETRRAWINAVAAWGERRLPKPGKNCRGRFLRACKENRRGWLDAQGRAGARACLLCGVDGRHSQSPAGGEVAKEELVRLMGLSGSDIDLPDPEPSAQSAEGIDQARRH